MSVGGAVAVELPKSHLKEVEFGTLKNCVSHICVLLEFCSAVEKIRIPHGRCIFEHWFLGTADLDLLDPPLGWCRRKVTSLLKAAPLCMKSKVIFCPLGLSCSA